jgi:hypothetical protein
MRLIVRLFILSARRRAETVRQGRRFGEGLIYTASGGIGSGPPNIPGMMAWA